MPTATSSRTVCCGDRTGAAPPAGNRRGELQDGCRGRRCVRHGPGIRAGGQRRHLRRTERDVRGRRSRRRHRARAAVGCRGDRSRVGDPRRLLPGGDGLGVRRALLVRPDRRAVPGDELLAAQRRLRATASRRTEWDRSSRLRGHRRRCRGQRGGRGVERLNRFRPSTSEPML